MPAKTLAVHCLHTEAAGWLACRCSSHFRSHYETLSDKFADYDSTDRSISIQFLLAQASVREDIDNSVLLFDI